MTSKLEGWKQRSLAAIAALWPLLPSPFSARAETVATNGGARFETYRGWENTVVLDNGIVEARIVTRIGPRILDFRLAGGRNVLHVRPDEAGGRGEPAWRFRGGWRLWVAPERTETTYALDNQPCEVERRGPLGVRVKAPPQPEAGIRKEIDVNVVAGQPRLRLVSRVVNVGEKSVTYAPWSLSVLRAGGRAFVPLDVGPPQAFDAIRRLILWSYTEVDDPRYRFGDRLVQIDHARVPPPRPDQAGRRDDESKIGVDSAQGWGAYLLGETLYLKRFAHDSDGRYPDGGSTIEVYSSHEFLELENLDPLATIGPGEAIELREDWWLFSGVKIREDEAGARADLQPYIEKAAFP